MSWFQAQNIYCDYLTNPPVLSERSHIDVLLARLKDDDENGTQGRLVASSIQSLFTKSGGVVYAHQYCRRLTDDYKNADDDIPSDIDKAFEASHADVIVTGEAFRPDKRLHLTIFARPQLDG